LARKLLDFNLGNVLPWHDNETHVPGCHVHNDLLVVGD
jgi:hypothetical protein